MSPDRPHRFGWLLPLALVALVAAGVWYFVFRDSRDERVDRLVAEAHAKMGLFEYAKSERLLLEAIDLIPESPLLHHNLAVLYLKQDRLAEARQEFERAAALYGPEANEVRAGDLFQLALIDVREKKYEEAERHLELAVRSHPTYTLYHTRLMDVQLSMLHKPEAADSTAARFLRLVGRTPRSLYDAAYVYHRRNQWQRAIEYGRQAVAMADTLLNAHAMVANAYWRSGQIDAGLEYLEGPLSRYPGAAELWVAKANLLVGGGRYEEAREAAAQALKVQPKNYNAHVARMMAYFNEGLWDEALAAVEACMPLAPNDYERRFLRMQTGRIRDKLRELRGDDPGGGGAATSGAASESAPGSAP